MPAVTDFCINGRFLCQRATGVQRVSREFTMALDQLIEDGVLCDLDVRLIAPDGADIAALGLRHIATEHLAGGTGYYWEQVALPRRVGRAHLLCLGNTAPMLSLALGRPVAVMLHDQSYKLFPEDYSAAYRLVHSVMGRMILLHARPLLTVSASEKTNILAANPRSTAPIVVAPNGSWIQDAQILPADHRARRGAKPGLYIGGIADRKNIEGVFATAAAVAESGYPFIFVCKPTSRSDAFLAALSEQARSNIQFTGFVSNEDLEALYRRAGYLLYPSLYEASGLPPSEAMTFGCPVIVSDLPVMRERCGDAALYCDPHDHAALIAAALRLVRDPELADKLSRLGLERVRLFTWRNQALKIVRALQDA